MSLRASIFLLPTFFLCGFLGLFAHVASCRCCQKRKCWITFLRWNNCPSSINSQVTPLNFPAVISAIITRTHCIQMHEPFSKTFTHSLAGKWRAQSLRANFCILKATASELQPQRKSKHNPDRRPAANLWVCNPLCKCWRCRTACDHRCSCNQPVRHTNLNKSEKRRVTHHPYPS